MKYFLLLTFLSVPLFGLGQNPNPNAELDAFILEEMGTENIPGMATIIVKDGEIVWRNSYGLANVAANVPVTDSTIFMLASISKLFTGTALMQLAEDGQINLDGPINAHMPFDVVNPNYPNTAITFRMLMTHTSSIKDNDPVMDTYYSEGDPTIPLSELMGRYFSPSGSDYDAQNNFLSTAPGAAFEYSNIATALAGYLVERVAQMPFDAYCNEHIFDRLCMRSTSWFLAGLDASQVARPHTYANGQYSTLEHYGFADYPDGQLRSNVNDLANFMLAFLQQGTFSSNQLLSAASVAEMLSAQVSGDEGVMGLNWYPEEIFLEDGGTVMLWGHNGGETGVSTDLYINPQNGIGVAVLSNGEGDNLYVVDALYNYALSLSPSGAGHPACASVSVEDAPKETSFTSYPNPTTGVVRWTGDGIRSVQVFNMQGAMVEEAQPNGGNSIDLSELPQGLYTLRFRYLDDAVASTRVILTK
jgi:CubicO group peptidase (beta-lactamase class C family)